MLRSSLAPRRQALLSSWALCQSHFCFSWQISATQDCKNPYSSVYIVHSDPLALTSYSYFACTRACNRKYYRQPSPLCNLLSSPLAPCLDFETWLGHIYRFSLSQFCLLMTGHQHLTLLNYLFSRAVALSHSTWQGCPSRRVLARTDECETIRMEGASTQTEPSVFTRSRSRQDGQTHSGLTSMPND